MEEINVTPIPIIPYIVLGLRSSLGYVLVAFRSIYLRLRQVEATTT